MFQSPLTDWANIASTTFSGNTAMNTAWQDSFLLSLAERDARESSLDEYFQPFSQAAALAVGSAALRMSLNREPRTVEEYQNELDHQLRQVDMYKKSYHQVEVLEKEIRQVKLKMQSRADENIMRQRAVQQLQDEILALQIQLNVSEEKYAKLEEENSSLVERYMARIESEANNMNKMNAIVEATQKKSSKSNRLPDGWPQIQSDDDDSE